MTNNGGPKTREGKSISSKNAIKHGITSKKLLSDEESSKLTRIFKYLTEEHTPQGETEEILIKDLAMIRIRLDRFDQIETSLIVIEQNKQSALDSILGAEKIHLRDKKSEFIKKIEADTTFSEEFTDQERDWCIQAARLIIDEQPLSDEALEFLRDSIRRDCQLHKTDPLGVIEIARNQSSYSSRRTSGRYSRPENEHEIEERHQFIESEIVSLPKYRLESYLSSKLSKEAFLEELDEMLIQIKSAINLHRDAALPPQGEMDRIYRYKNNLEKQFSTKLSQLIQLQEIKAKKARIKAIQN